MSRLYETEVFVTVVDAGSFSGAARELEVSRSYVSKMVSRLEDRLGVRLLQRSTRKLSLTQPGAHYYEQCSRALGLVREAEDTAAALHRLPRGRLRVSLPTGLGMGWHSQMLAEFMAQHPDVHVDAIYSDRYVDLLAEGFDVAIRVGELPDSSLIARRVAVAKRFVVASPDYLEAHGEPAHPRDLVNHRCLRYSTANRRLGLWRFSSENGESESVSVTGPLVTNRGVALSFVAAQGMGLAYIPEFHTADCLASGRLRRVLDGWESSVPIHAVYPTSRHVPSKVSAFVEFLAQCLDPPPWTRWRLGPRQ